MSWSRERYIGLARIYIVWGEILADPATPTRIGEAAMATRQAIEPVLMRYLGRKFCGLAVDDFVIRKFGAEIVVRPLRRSIELCEEPA
jgi:hypothetical protein